ncbi:MAG TPA: NADH-quinone oxidoreductase subunit C [Candidatus Binataceae bacterium]|nr:NADH-quinone oxidoreductase subunit C [Candidatus Binataceae bacterium]
MSIDKLKERFGADVLGSEDARGEETIVVGRDRAPEILKALRDEPGFEFNMLSDLTAVDWPDRKPRFDVVYHLNSLTLRHRLRVKVQIEGGEAWVTSAAGIWKAADWLERECYDMFGIRFHGHPDLRRILLYDSFEGHPLRKDYPYQRRQPVVPETDPVVNPLRPSR